MLIIVLSFCHGWVGATVKRVSISAREVRFCTSCLGAHLLGHTKQSAYASLGRSFDCSHAVQFWTRFPVEDVNDGRFPAESAVCSKADTENSGRGDGLRADAGTGHWRQHRGLQRDECRAAAFAAGDRSQPGVLSAYERR